MLVNRTGNPVETFRYSTEEKYTGKNWINGKKIYAKTVYLKNSSYISKNENITYDFIFDEIWIDHSASWARIGNAGSPASTGGRIIPFSYYRSSSGYYEIYLDLNKFSGNNSIDIDITMNKETGMIEFYCTLLYTKND